MEMLTHKVEDLMYVVRDETLEFSKEILEILQIGLASMPINLRKFTGTQNSAICLLSSFLFDIFSVFFISFMFTYFFVTQN